MKQGPTRLLAIALMTCVLFPAWKRLDEGAALTWGQAKRATPVGDGRILVVRIDPAEWELVLVGPALGDGAGKHTAREWAELENLAMVTNAGMFAGDHAYPHFDVPRARPRKGWDVEPSRR